LITLVFPIRPQDDLGPPHWVQPEHYVEVLGEGSGGSNPEGWEKVFDKEPEKAVNTSRFDDRHVGKARMVVWKRICVYVGEYESIDVPPTL
jgi:methyl halide transferase